MCNQILLPGMKIITLTFRLIDLASFRDIGSVLYIKANVRYEYFTSTHNYYLWVFVIPWLFFFLFLIPISMYLRLALYKHTLNKIQNRLKWGFLYNEYQPSAYFWEFIKMVVKVYFLYIKG
jgi:hypothetical protein